MGDGRLVGLASGVAAIASACGGSTEPAVTAVGTVVTVPPLPGSPTPVTVVEPPPSLDPDRVASGGVLYEEFCARCHGSELEGAPDWQLPGEDGSYPPPPQDPPGARGTGVPVVTDRAIPSRALMRRVASLVWTVALGAVVACGGSDTSSDIPGDPGRGATVFAANCAECHGADAAGSDEGPPLVDPIYRSGHHADGAFVVAIRRGVPQHHWNFGTMPPQDGLTDQDVRDVTACVRRLQREAGIE